VSYVSNPIGCVSVGAHPHVSVPGFWMSDKPLVQQRLASDLSSLILSIEPVNDSSTAGIDSRTNAGLDFVAGFWEALVREWTGIDRLRYALNPWFLKEKNTTEHLSVLSCRMDKYYMLIRRWQNATFRLLARSGWSKEAVKRFNDILTAPIGGPLSLVFSNYREIEQGMLNQTR
jgi:ribosomal RNA-processing protein 1